jgi:hypothetical protein
MPEPLHTAPRNGNAILMYGKAKRYKDTKPDPDTTAQWYIVSWSREDLCWDVDGGLVLYEASGWMHMPPKPDMPMKRIEPNYTN